VSKQTAESIAQMEKNRRAISVFLDSHPEFGSETIILDPLNDPAMAANQNILARAVIQAWGDFKRTLAEERKLQPNDPRLFRGIPERSYQRVDKSKKDLDRSVNNLNISLRNILPRPNRPSDPAMQAEKNRLMGVAINAWRMISSLFKGPEGETDTARSQRESELEQARQSLGSSTEAFRAIVEIGDDLAVCLDTYSSIDAFNLCKFSSHSAAIA